MDRHFAHLEVSDGLEAWRRSVAGSTVTEAVRGIIEESLAELLNGNSLEFEDDIERVSQKVENPLSVAHRWLAKLDFSQD
jgi:hypothetical protein